MTFTLPELPYDFNALEPYIDKETMQIHHDKHHGTYVEKLNVALQDKKEFENFEISEILKNINAISEDVRTAVKNNGGGHANHTLFWEIMAPATELKPSGKLEEAINSTFGNFDTFIEKFSTAAISRFGSGWAWLIVENGKLSIIDTPNQDSPLMDSKTPILGLDVWEHAYYLMYQNKRADYIKAWWNVVNWTKVEENFNLLQQ